MPEEAKRLKRTATTRLKRERQPSFDWPIFIIVMTLLVFGLVMLFSASFATAYFRMNGDSYFYIRQQALFAGFGLVLMIIVSLIDYHILHRLALPILLVTIVLLVVVLFMPEVKGTTRWIYLPFRMGTFQPSELAKFAIILLFSHLISLNYNKMKTLKYGVLPFVIALGIVVTLLFLEPHLSAIVLIVMIGVILMFVGGTSLLWFGIAFGLIVVAVVAVVVLRPDTVPYAMSRIQNFFDIESNTQSANYQVIQSLYAIGSGGLFGLGIGNSRQKHLYLPEPQNDFIFAVLCEELGFIGAMLVVFLFVLLMARGIYIACKAKDKFGSMLVVGIITQIVMQAVLNIAVVTHTIPNTGISLPFFSAGGTSLVMLLCEMGVVLSVSRQSSIGKS